MFRAMRRKDRCLSEDEARNILKQGKFGVLSLIGEDGYPYGVPMHYVMEGDSLFVHCSAQGGHKTDAIDSDSRVCFTVVETEDGIKSRSAIFFGKAQQVTKGRKKVLEKMVEKFVPKFAWEQAKAGIPYAVDRIKAYELKIEHLTAKWIDKPEDR